MSVIKDCGDMTVSVAIRTGVKYVLEAVGEDETLFRTAIDEKVADIIPQLEKTILDQICDHIGYDQDKIKHQVALREGKNAADRKAETEGRAAKSAVRAGLPPLTPPPPIEQGLTETSTDEKSDEREED